MDEIQLLTQISNQLTQMQSTMVLPGDLAQVISFLVGAMSGIAFVLGIRSMNI